jgi:hypothetical protein
MTHADRDQAFGAQAEPGAARDQAIADEAQADQFQDRDVVVVSETRIAEAGNEGFAAEARNEGEAEPAARRTQLLATDELDSVMTRWREIQAQFVDEPRNAVTDADALVAELMERLARMFAGEREQLESRWRSGNDVSTEDLRQGLRRYRSFFERLLAA